MENQNLKEEVQELKYSIKQLEYVIKDLAGITKRWDETTGVHEKNLVKAAEGLAEENFVLQKLPEKVGSYLKQIIPDISRHIQESTLKDFEYSIVLCNKKLADLSNKVHEVIKKVEICQGEQLKNKLKSLAINLVLLIAIGSGSTYLICTYLLDKRFPSQVFIKPSGDVNIGNSTVSIHQSGKTNVYDNKKPQK